MFWELRSSGSLRSEYVSGKPIGPIFKGLFGFLIVEDGDDILSQWNYYYSLRNNPQERSS